jgi:hypothetical protein
VPERVYGLGHDPGSDGAWGLTQSDGIWLTLGLPSLQHLTQPVSLDAPRSPAWRLHPASPKSDALGGLALTLPHLSHEVVFPAVWRDLGIDQDASLLLHMGLAAQGGVFWGVLMAGAEKQVES